MSISPLYGILTFVIFSVCAVGLGAGLLRLVNLGERGGMYLCLCWGVGAGLLSAVMFFLCLAGAATPVAIAAVGVISAVPLILERKKIAAAFGDIFGAAFGAGAPVAAKVCVAGTVLLVAGAFIAALAPPVEIDALSYHLLLPKIYAGAHGFVPTPTIVYSFFPLAAEMDYLYPLAAGSAVGAALIHFTFGALTVLGIASLARRLSGGETKVASLAALIFAATPVVFWEMHASYNDLAMAFFLFMAFAVVAGGGTDDKDMRRAALAGLLAGFATAAKLTAGPCAVFLAVYVAAMTGGGARRRIAALVCFCVLCVAPVAPWLIRTYHETGNPVFPFAYQLFGGTNWNPAVNKEFLEWHSNYGPGRGLKELIALPYNLTFRAAGNFGWPMPMPDRGIGVLFLFLLPVLFVPGGVLKKRGHLAAYTVFALVAWFFGTQQTRFLLSFLPMLCMMYAAGIVRLSEAGKAQAGVVVGAVAALLIAVNSLYQIGTVVSAARACTGGAAAKQKYISTRSPSYPAFMALEGLSGGGKTGLLLETRSFYSDSRVEWLDPTRQGVIDYEKIGNSGELAAELRKMGVRYLLINRASFMRLYQELDRRRIGGMPYPKYILRFFGLYHDLLNSGAKPVYGDQIYMIYDISGVGPAPGGR